jgi:hypothetical protein
MWACLQLGLVDHIIARLRKCPQPRQLDRFATQFTAAIGTERKLAQSMLHFGELVFQIQLLLMSDSPGFNLHAGIALIAFELCTGILAWRAPHVFCTTECVDLGLEALFPHE